MAGTGWTSQRFLKSQRERLPRAMAPCVSSVLDSMVAWGFINHEEHEDVDYRRPTEAARRLLTIAEGKGEEVEQALLLALWARGCVDPPAEMRAPLVALRDELDARCASCVGEDPEARLRRIRPALVESFDDVGKVVEELVQQGALGAEDQEKILLPSYTRPEQVRTLLNLLDAKGPQSATAFLDLVDVEKITEQGPLKPPVHAFQRKLQDHHESSSRHLLAYSRREHALLDDVYVEVRLQALAQPGRPSECVTLDSLARGEWLSDRERKDVLLVTGDAGSGKTTLLQRLTGEWSRGRLLSCFELVFAFGCGQLNVVKKELSLRELLFNHCCSPGDDDGGGGGGGLDVVVRYVAGHPEKVLFCFDAIDEFREDFLGEGRVCSSTEEPVPMADLLKNLLQGNVLRGSKKIVTARTGASLQPLDVHVCRRVAIAGFSDDAVLRYQQKFHSDEGARRNACELIRTNADIRSLCQVPLYCWIVSKCYDRIGGRGGSVSTVTEIYLSMLEVFLTRGESKATPTSRTTLFSANRDALLRIGKLAHVGLLAARTSFTAPDLDACGVTPWDLALGATVHTRRYAGFGEGDVYGFVHFTVQALFAALYAVASAELGPEALLAHFPSAVRPKAVRRVVGALGSCVAAAAAEAPPGSGSAPRRPLAGSGGANRRAVCQFASGLLSKRHGELLARLSGEASVRRKRAAVRKQLRRSVKDHVRGLNDRDGHLTPDFVWVLRWLFEFQEEKVARKAARDFAGGHVKLNYTSLGPADCTCLSYLLRHLPRPVVAELDNNFIGDLGLQQLLPCIGKFSDLRLSINRITDRGVDILIPELIKHNIVTFLGLFKNQLTDESTPLLAELVTKSSHLKSLALGENRITGEGMVPLANAIKHSKSLKVILLWGNAVGDRGAECLADALEVNATLEFISLVSNKVGHAGVARLADVLHRNSTLKTLWLGENDLGDEEAFLLADCLKSNKGLKELWLNKNKITMSGARALLDALQDNATVEKVVLRQNALSEEEYKEVLAKEHRMD
ncbi:nucleotide-binding oligomerization domain-containing protein 2 [Lampetra fluviatilis]